MLNNFSFNTIRPKHHFADTNCSVCLTFLFVLVDLFFFSFLNLSCQFYHCHILYCSSGISTQFAQFYCNLYSSRFRTLLFSTSLVWAFCCDFLCCALGLCKDTNRWPMKPTASIICAWPLVFFPSFLLLTTIAISLFLVHALLFWLVHLLNAFLFRLIGLIFVLIFGIAPFGRLV